LRGCRCLRAARRSQRRCRSEQTGRSLVHNSSLEGSPARPLCEGNNPLQALFVPALRALRRRLRRRRATSFELLVSRVCYAAALGRADIA
jgi:hypothetical protein